MKRCRILLGYMLASLCLLSGGTWAQVVTEFAIPTANGDPIGVTIGPTRFWFAGDHRGKIRRLPPQVSSGAFARPRGWVSPQARWRPLVPEFNKMGGSHRGVITEPAIPTVNALLKGSPPPGRRSLVHRIIASDRAHHHRGVVTEFAIPNVSGTRRDRRGSDGPLSSRNQREQHWAITTAGTITEFAIPTVGNSLRDRPRPDGALGSPNTVATRSGASPPRVSSLSLRSRPPAPRLWRLPLARERHSGSPNAARVFLLKIGRITTAGVITEFAIPTANGEPLGIAAGPDGALWFTRI